MHDDFDHGYRQPPRDKRAFVEDELARLSASGPMEDPGVTARKAAERAQRLKAADHLFGTYWGCTLGAKPPGHAKVTAGDDTRGIGNDD